ncbi:MAG: hypothetical protein IPJ19_08145 [Planctomycetes bacterium]|nr:hypothetical protein [Planctomycetota bacterium]
MQVLEQIQRMSPERFLAIYQSLEQHGFGPLDGEVAKLLKFRPQAIRKLPMDQRARTARRLLESSHNAQLAYEILGAYLIKHKKGIVTGFLDATGVKHQDGMIENVDEEKPSVDKLVTALNELDKQFPPEDVTIYLAICAEQWPDVTQLDELWRKRAALAGPPDPAGGAALCSRARSLGGPKPACSAWCSRA